MKNLSENWITEGWIDFEYKKYLLLAYLQEVSSQFKEVKLYPPLADLIRHQSRLKSFLENRDLMKDAFPKMLNESAFKEMKLNYRPLYQDDETMRQLEEIVAYALPKLQLHIEEGKNIYDFLENEMKIEPIGLSPLYQKEGYAFLSLEKSKDIYVYRYKINLFQNSVDSFKGIMMEFVKRVRRTFVNTLEQVKLDLIKSYRELPNPATYRIHSRFQIPLQESFLPISKRLLLKKVE
ncbi:hypothetical protein [Rhodonellum sp.]|uniref:hypothetical protein n=1 Tax=Rhodonellum sp. TaxID=2231180 RepID=UPI00271A0872|nr:hypothetical protein [Rhodonellum sp.]MDO9551812.1 hypothetical protein [Rhodonellum sp.]